MDYRILQEGEIIQEDDEVDISQHLNEEPVWVKTTCVGQKAPNPLYPAHRVYRRPTPRVADEGDSAPPIYVFSVRDLHKKGDSNSPLHR